MSFVLYIANLFYNCNNVSYTIRQNQHLLGRNSGDLAAHAQLFQRGERSVATGDVSVNKWDNFSVFFYRETTVRDVERLSRRSQHYMI